jgi:hypothetical protein
MQIIAEKRYEDAAGADARRRLVRVAAAAAAYRARHDRYPDSVEELTPEFLPELLPDPFNGTPFRLAPEGDGLAIYAGLPPVDDPAALLSSKQGSPNPFVLHLR